MKKNVETYYYYRVTTFAFQPWHSAVEFKGFKSFVSNKQATSFAAGLYFDFAQ
ncbi:oleate hydratase [Nostoc sp.]